MGASESVHDPRRAAAGSFPPEAPPPGEPVGLDAYLAALSAALPGTALSHGVDLHGAVVTLPIRFALRHNELLRNACDDTARLPPLSLDACANILALLHASTHAQAARSLRVFVVPPDPRPDDIAHRALRLRAPLLCYGALELVPEPARAVALDIPAGARAVVVAEPAHVAGVAAVLPAGAMLGGVHHEDARGPQADILVGTLDTRALTAHAVSAIAPHDVLSAVLSARLRTLAIMQVAFAPENLALTASARGFLLRDGALAAACAQVGIPAPHADLASWLAACEASGREQLAHTAAALRCLAAGVPILTPAARGAISKHWAASPALGGELLRELGAACDAAVAAVERGNDSVRAVRTYVELATLIGQEVNSATLAGRTHAIRLLRTFVDVPTHTEVAREYTSGMGVFGGFVSDEPAGALARGTSPEDAWAVFSSVAAALERVGASPDAAFSRLLRTAWELAAGDVARLCTALQLPSSIAAADAYTRPAAQRAISLLLLGEAAHALLLAPGSALPASPPVDALVVELRAANERRACETRDVAAASVAWLNSARHVLAGVAALPTSSAPQAALAKLAARVADNVPGALAEDDFPVACVALEAWLGAAKASRVGGDARPMRITNLARVMGDFASAYRVCLPCIAALGGECRGPKCAEPRTARDEPARDEPARNERPAEGLPPRDVSSVAMLEAEEEVDAAA